MADKVLVLGDGEPRFIRDVVGELLKQGRCPNGCGLMAVEDGLQRCGTCRFLTNTMPDPPGEAN